MIAETPTDMLVAGCPDIDGATKDFESLAALVRDTQVSIDGVILVTYAPDGSVAVRQTCGSLGREAPGAVGAVAGGVIGEFAGHRVEQDIHDHSDSYGERYEPESSRR